MSPFPLIPPDGSDWTIDAIPTADGIELAIIFTLQGQPITARFVMDRPDARALSDGLRTAAGDGTMRTFPRPQLLKETDDAAG